MFAEVPVFPTEVCTLTVIVYRIPLAAEISNAYFRSAKRIVRLSKLPRLSDRYPKNQMSAAERGRGVETH